jgi:hypothetical protein
VTRRSMPARPTRLVAGALAAAAILATAGFTTAPAHSEASSQCPTEYPAADITYGQPVTADTTVENNQPATVAGTTIGVLKDGVSPGVDMILVRFADDSVVGKLGVWSGMSGSPVYAGDGRLIGAVAYSLGGAPSTIAGVTPAAYMQRLLSDGAKPTAQPAQTVAIPQRMAARLVASGAASSAQVDQGARLLRVPFGVGGLSARRLDQLAGLYKLGQMRVAGGLSGTAAQDAPAPLAAGDSFAASMAHGTISAAGFGTVTMVCGNEVVGFGHPMNLTGPSHMTLHSSRVLTVQDDAVFSGFVVPELGPAIGKIDQDRTAGVHGVIGSDQVPAGAPVVSNARSGGSIGLPGGDTFHADTTVTVPEIFSQIAFTSMLASQDKVMDQYTGGSGTAWWRVKGTTDDGEPFTLYRSDSYADTSDISSAMALTFAGQLTTLEENGTQGVTFTSAQTGSTIDRPYQKWNISGVDLRRNGRFHRLFEGFPAAVRAGYPAVLRVHLTSKQLGTRTTEVRVNVPKHARRHNGTLELVGGDDAAPVAEFYSDGFDTLDGFPGDTGASVDELLQGFRSAPHHNQITATISFPRAPGLASVPRTGKHKLVQVIGGSFDVPVHAVR